MSIPRGFVLTELLVALALVAILLALAVPGYRELVMRSHRVAAKSALYEVAARQERFRVEHQRYSLSLTELGLGEPYFIDGGINRVGAQRAVYKIELALHEEEYLGVNALPANHQARDSDCGTFTLGRRGERSVNGSWSGQPRRCW